MSTTERGPAAGLAVHYSSDRQDWETPVALFAALDREFIFELDVCAVEANKKCALYFGPDHPFPALRDCLPIPWGEPGWPTTCWMNPPYGNPEFPCKPRCTKKRCAERGHHVATYVPGILDFVAKARAEALAGRATTVCLLPARTDTHFWHGHIWDGATHRPYPGVEVRFLRGRVPFVGAPAGAPFPSAIVVFRAAAVML